MIDLKASPFLLSDGQVEWVQNTLASMTEDEKIGQLFCPISYSSDEGYLQGALLRHHIGGLQQQGCDRNHLSAQAFSIRDYQLLYNETCRQ